MKTTSNINLHEEAKQGLKGREGNSANERQTDKAGQSVDRTGPGQNLVTERKCKYRGRRADFDPFAASIFVRYSFIGLERALSGWGAVALACVTGIPPRKIAARHRGRHSPIVYVSYLETTGLPRDGALADSTRYRKNKVRAELQQFCFLSTFMKRKSIILLKRTSALRRSLRNRPLQTEEPDADGEIAMLKERTSHTRLENGSASLDV